MMQLPTIQANSLRIVFEEQFDENEIYFDHVEIDEIFNVLIGGEIDPHFYNMLEVSSKVDDFSKGFTVMIHEYIETIQFEAVDLEFYELAHNCKILKEKINQIIKSNE